MNKFSVEFYVFAPSDEGMPFREWALVECFDETNVRFVLRRMLIEKGFLQPGQYLEVCKIIKES